MSTALWAKNPPMKKWHIVRRPFGQALCGLPQELDWLHGGVKKAMEPPHDLRCRKCVRIDAAPHNPARA